MHVSRRYPTRLVLAIAIAATVLVIGAAAAFGQELLIGSAGQRRRRLRDAGNDGRLAARCGRVLRDRDRRSGVVLRNIGCRAGTHHVGQATIDGQDPAARDAAIAAAVKDATAQANAAADAAGIQLGSIIDMQVSVMPSYAYPMVGAASGSSPGSPGGGGGMEPAPAPDVFQGSVSVTVTWALS